MTAKTTINRNLPTPTHGEFLLAGAVDFIGIDLHPKVAPTFAIASPT
jgi:hypothetical protein